MTHVFRIEDSTPYAKSVVEFLKTLDFVKEEKIENDVKSKSSKLTLAQKNAIDKGLQDIEDGNVIPYKEAREELKKRNPKYFK